MLDGAPVSPKVILHAASQIKGKENHPLTWWTRAGFGWITCWSFDDFDFDAKTAEWDALCHYHLQCYSDTPSFLSLFSFLLPPCFSYSHSYSILVLPIIILLVVLLLLASCKVSLPYVPSFNVFFVLLILRLLLFLTLLWLCFFHRLWVLFLSVLNACKATLPWHNSSVSQLDSLNRI